MSESVAHGLTSVADQDDGGPGARGLNVEKVLSATSAVLKTEFSDMPPVRSIQVPVVWLRAVMQQCRAIVALSNANLDHAAAPSRRSASEVLLRLQWLVPMSPEDRAGAIDAMIEEEKRLTANHKNHVVEMGLTEAPDLGNFEDVLTRTTDDIQLRQQARSVMDAAKAANGVGLYRAWREETQMTHATVQLAAANAPIRADRFEHGTAPTHDPDLSLSLDLASFAVIYTSRLLLDAGLAMDDSFRFFTAFFAGIRKVI